MSVEDDVAALRVRLADVEEKLRLLRDADRLQGRRVSAAAPDNNAPLRWNATTKKWEATLAASEVKTARKRSVEDSTTRVTVATPTSGKKIRITSSQVWNGSDTASIIEVYFGTGAAITTTAGKEIQEANLDANAPEGNFGLVWPDGGGPIGAVDDVVSFRTSTNVTTLANIVIAYREE